MEEVVTKVQFYMMLLKVFQFLTVGIIVLLAVRFKTFDSVECWKVNKSTLRASGLILSGMIFYEYIEYDSFSVGYYGAPMGLQLVTLLAVVYFYYQKKE